MRRRKQQISKTSVSTCTLFSVVSIAIRQVSSVQRKMSSSEETNSKGEVLSGLWILFLTLQTIVD